MSSRVLLLSSNNATIHDFEISMRVVGIEMLVARTTSEANRYILGQRPKIIFFHTDLLGEGGDVITFAGRLADDTDVQKIPRVILVSKWDKDKYPQDFGWSYFTKVIELPIEFPTFSETIVQLINEQHAVFKHIEEPLESDISVLAVADKDKEKLRLVKAIQKAVFDEIMAEIGSIEISDISAAVIAITERVVNRLEGIE